MWTEFREYQQQRRSLFYPKADLPGLPEVSSIFRTGPVIPPPAVVQVATKVVGRPPTALEPLAEGGPVYLLYRARWDDGTSALLRFNAQSGQQRDFGLVLEPWAMDVLRGHGLPALSVLDVDLSRSLCPWDYQVLEEASGQPLRAFDRADDLLRPHLVELGRVVAQLHQIPAEDFGFLAVDSLSHDPKVLARGLWPTWPDYLGQNLDDHLRTCLDSDAINLAESHVIHGLFTAPKHRWASCAPRLLHGDLSLHNVFVEEGKISALVDWQDCLAGDPVFEIACWATCQSEHRHKAFLQGYQSAQALPVDFEERFWLYFLRIALAQAVHRHRLSLRELPGRTPAIQRALSQFNGRRLAA